MGRPLRQADGQAKRLRRFSHRRHDGYPSSLLQASQQRQRLDWSCLVSGSNQYRRLRGWTTGRTEYQLSHAPRPQQADEHLLFSPDSDPWHKTEQANRIEEHASTAQCSPS
eukprot:5982855-Amphidinium_carterae.1